MADIQLDTVRRYLRHLHASDTAGLVACFEDDGIVHSPFLGTMQARDFFARLAQASSQSVITPIDLFASVQPADDTVRVAAYFRYDWTLSDGRLVDFTCVDVFGFRPGSPRIASMHIVYDTHPLRERVGDKYAPDPPQPAPSSESAHGLPRPE
ncbi:MAG: nuclear transport factor 2 family protein [Curvibacter sp.]|nr:nuclear transport factor 2 family protein [Curvibacter sp.]